MNTTGNSRPLAAWSVISVTASASPSYESWSATSAVSSSSRSSASSGDEVVVAGRRPRAARAGWPSDPRPPASRRPASPGSRTPRAPRRAARAAAARRSARRSARMSADEAGDGRPGPGARAPRPGRRPPPRARPRRVAGSPLAPATRPRSCLDRLARRCRAPGTLMIRSKAADVVSLRSDAQVGQRVLDLAALVEARAADELVAHAVAQERLLDRPALGVGAVHDRDVARRSGRSSPVVGARGPGSSRDAAGQRLDLARDPLGLLLLAVGLEALDRPAARVLRPQLLVLARLVAATTAWAASRISCVER